jgi:hypothetical protein
MMRIILIPCQMLENRSMNADEFVVLFGTGMQH